MPTLIIDIETVGEEWEEVDAATQRTLTQWIERQMLDPVQSAREHQRVKEGLGLSPLTGRVVALGLYDVERAEAVVYYDTAGTSTAAPSVAPEVTFKVATEAQMLQHFWEGVVAYDTVVTFNGRRFDVPFLWHRSAVHGIAPSCNLLTHRRLEQQTGIRHVDLLDQFTFYGAWGRRPSLALLCHTYGIEQPKTETVNGAMMRDLYRAGRVADIAAYNAADLWALQDLYQIWQDYFSLQDPRLV